MKKLTTEEERDEEKMKPPSTEERRNVNKLLSCGGGGVSNVSPSSSSSILNCSFIKPSLSLTSLPPPKEQQDGREVIKAKLRMERPYNSLKKNRNSDGHDTWRHSWGSGHSHSSCSLHSNATGSGGAGFINFGKDDFWAALQTNYNYIMDTNLLDTCKEARYEIEGASSAIRNTQECCQKRFLQSSQPEGSCEDPKELRKWLRDMENKLSNAPSLSEATQMSIAELQRRLAEHSVLYCEIVSHARVVGACVRASEKENNYSSLSSDDKTTTASSPNSKRNSSDGNLKGLERRYHLLYLKAIEVQCLFEGLLGKKNSTGVLSRSSSTETDDEPVSKLARLSDSETTNTHASCDLLSIQQTISDENKSEDDDCEEFWSSDNPIVTATAATSSAVAHKKTILTAENDIHGYANVDFDADSEGSDCDEITKIYKIKDQIHNNHHHNNYQRCYVNCVNGVGNKKDKLNNRLIIKSKINNHKENNDDDWNSSSILSENMDSSNSCKSGGSIDFLVTTTTGATGTSSDKSVNLTSNSNNQTVLLNCCAISSTSTATANRELGKSGSGGAAISAAVESGLTSPNSSGGGGGGGSDSVGISSIKKRQRNTVDASKFNRSNRKSKNCAIFYFKHLDTDNENFGGISSQGSDAIKSGEPSSVDEDDDDDYDDDDDDEGWLFSNDCIDGGKHHLTLNEDDSDKENKEIECNSVSNCSGTGDGSGSNPIVNCLTTPANMNESLEMKLNYSKVDTLMNNCFNGNGIGTISNEEEEEEKEKDESPMMTTSKCDVGLEHLKGEIDVEAVTIMKIVSCGSSGNTNKNSSCKSSTGTKGKLKMSKMSNKGFSHESIKQLVLDAENLVRDEIMRTPNKRHSHVKKNTASSSSIKKREINMAGSNIKRVQEWLEHQPITTKDGLNPFSAPTTDCEASGEYTESDSAARESDTSEGFTDSVATCMQTTGSTSQCTSTEIIGGSAEPIANVGSNPSLSTGNVAVVRRTNRRNSDRPWSVSCLSQLTENDTIKVDKVNNNQDLASHSVSESALHILSSPGKKKHSPPTAVKTSESKNSLRRRKARRRKIAGKRSDSGSEGILPYDLPKLTQTLMKSESINGHINIIQDLALALEIMSLPKNNNKKVETKSTSDMESEEEQALMKPNFKLGSYTSAFMTNESKLGSLAALANYMNEEHGEYHTGTEDHSSFSEQAWDNYQEKYNSENYSEGFDSDAARKLLEFGDDYRNFLDSQSDCCSSLSAANNFDSMSPPQMDSLKQNETMKISQQQITSSVDHARRRRALELQYERRRKNSEMKKKSQDDVHHLRSPNTSSSTLHPTSPRSFDKNTSRGNLNDSMKKLDLDFNCSLQSLRKTSESDNSTHRRRKSDDAILPSYNHRHRRSSKTLEKSFKPIPSTSSSSNDESDDEKEMKNLLTQSRNRLENTNALKIRSHLLRPEDYAEIVATCRDNIRCLESVLRGPPGTVLSSARVNETRDLLSSWENLLGWSENALAARKMQEEMVMLKNALNRLGRQTCEFDSESSIQFIIEELKNEKTQLQTNRTNMLRLNASVHSWLTRQELKLKKELESLENESENNNNMSQEKGSQINTVIQSENEFHKHLKDEVSDMYSAWDDADIRINSHLEALTASLIAWRQLECGLSEFHQVLGKDRGTLKGLEGALNRGQATSSELAQNVKLVAKLLSEKIDCHQQQQVLVSSQEQQDPNRILSITQFTSSNGSLSDSGISDGGATSDGGLSERERRLGVLRRLAKQLENALAPGSEALKSITARMEAAEAELKTLQNTCRELIVRTAVSQHKKSQALMTYNGSLGVKSQQSKNKKSPSSKKKNRRRSLTGAATGSLFKSIKKTNLRQQQKQEQQQEQCRTATAPNPGDPDDPNGNSWEICNSDDDDDSNRSRGWAWRVAKIALPMQLALLTLFCAACLMEPHCCDSLNNLSMSFTPQLRYIRGPPPV